MRPGAEQRLSGTGKMSGSVWDSTGLRMVLPGELARSDGEKRGLRWAAL